jgi:hypothetical protein
MRVQPCCLLSLLLLLLLLLLVVVVLSSVRVVLFLFLLLVGWSGSRTRRLPGPESRGGEVGREQKLGVPARGSVGISRSRLREEKLGDREPGLWVDCRACVGGGPSLGFCMWTSSLEVEVDCCKSASASSGMACFACLLACSIDRSLTRSSRYCSRGAGRHKVSVGRRSREAACVLVYGRRVCADSCVSSLLSRPVVSCQQFPACFRRWDVGRWTLDVGRGMWEGW